MTTETVNNPQTNDPVRTALLLAAGTRRWTWYWRQRSPLELPGLVEIRLREYAGQVTETQAWHGDEVLRNHSRFRRIRASEQ